MSPVSEFELPDVNVLVALLHPDHVHHHAAGRWFSDVACFATTPITEVGLLRLALNPVVIGRPLTRTDALTSLRSLRNDVRASFLPDDSSLADAAIELDGLVGFRQVTDLHLVNLVAVHSGVLVTFDSKLAPTLAPDDRRYVRTLH